MRSECADGVVVEAAVRRASHRRFAGATQRKSTAHGHACCTSAGFKARAAKAARREYSLVVPQISGRLGPRQVDGTAQARLRPHRLERYMASNDPQFEAKAADIIGLYLNPPQRAAVFCVDEKTAIQALDRLDPVLPMSPGRAERHGFEYYRQGTLSLYAALDIKTGKVEGKTAKRHTSEEFIDFLTLLVNKARWAREIHVVLDNLSAHKTKNRGTVPGRAPQSTIPLHADLLVMAQPGRTLVRQDPTRCY